MENTVAVVKGAGKATAALVLGIVGIVFFLIPLIGLPTSIVGIVLGARGTGSPNRKQAVAGLTMSIIGASLSVLWWVISAALIATNGY